MKYPKKLKAYHRKWYEKEMDSFKLKAGGKCIVCKENNKKVLLFHHVFFNGEQHRKSMSCRRVYYKSMFDGTMDKSYPVQLVCHNCHKLIHEGAKGVR